MDLQWVQLKEDVASNILTSTKLGRSKETISASNAIEMTKEISTISTELPSTASTELLQHMELTESTFSGTN
jgi:hypothetical protein